MIIHHVMLGLLLISVGPATVGAQPSSRNAKEFTPAPQESSDRKISLDSVMAAVDKCDALSLRLQLHYDLQEIVDEPVAQFLLDEIKSKLGKPKDDEWTESTEVKKVDGEKTYTTKASIPFEQGLLKIQFSHSNDKITSFEFKSPKLEKLGQKLGERLVSDAKFNKSISNYYHGRYEPLISCILRGRDQDAHELLHPDIQQQISLEKAKEVFAAVREEYGQLKEESYTGLSLNWGEDGAFKNAMLNFELVCGKKNAHATVTIQFVGLDGAITGVNFMPLGPEAEVEEDKTKKVELKTYLHEKENLSEKHVANFVPFQFEYPKGWEVDKTAGTDESPNCLKVYRNVDLENEQTYTQENFAVGSCQISGTGELAKIQLQFLSEQFRGQIEKGFPEFSLKREGEMKFGKYDGYGFEFSSKIPHPTKEKVDCWGRVILLPPSAIGQAHGLSIVMLATSEAPELKSLDDLGTKGQLPILIDSFQVGAKAIRKADASDDVPLPPIPALPIPRSVTPPPPPAPY